MVRRSRFLLLISLLFILPSLATPCAFYEDYLRVAGSLGWSHDPPSDMMLLGDTAYVPCGRDGLRVYDISDPLNIVAVDIVETGGLLGDATTDGDYLYLADKEYGLHIVELSDPQHPTLIGSVETPGEAWDVAVRGDWAFVADGLPGMISVVDISDRSNPAHMLYYYVPNYVDYLLSEIAIAGNYVYVRRHPTMIVDVSDPLAPETIGEFAGHEIVEIVVSGNLAITAEWARLRVWTIDDPAAPVFQSFIDQNSPIYEIEVEGNTLLAIGMNATLYDISDPASPIMLGSTGVPGYAQAGLILDEHAIVGADEWGNGFMGGLHTLDTGNTANPDLLASVPIEGRAAAVDVEGDLAVLAAISNGSLVLFDVSQPELPVPLGVLPELSQASEVELRGDHAFVAEGSTPVLNIVDITDPAAPFIVGTTPTGGAIKGITAEGDLVCVAAQYYGIEVFDVSDPAAPVSLSVLSAGMLNFNDVDLQGDFAYVVDGDARFHVADLSDPAHPILVATLDDLYRAVGITVNGDRAFVARYDQGIQVLDISEPAAPVDLGGTHTLNNAVQVALHGDHLYVADEWAGMTVVDIETPSEPIILGGIPFLFETIPFDSKATGIAVNDEAVFVAARQADFQILPLECTDLTALDEEAQTARIPRLAIWPNPGNPNISLRFELPEAVFARLTIHNVTGRRVATLLQEDVAAGEQVRIWHGVDDAGLSAPSGVYLARLESAGLISTSKFVLLR